MTSGGRGLHTPTGGKDARLKPVNENHRMQKLRIAELFTRRTGELTILDIDALPQQAGFDPNYLRRGKPAGREAA